MLGFLKNLPPTLSDGLPALLLLVATAVVARYTDLTGTVPIPKDIMVQATGCISSLFLWLLMYSLSLHNKLDKKEERKIKILKWREDLKSCKSLEDIYKTSTYLDLKQHATKNETIKIAKTTSNNVISITVGAITKLETPHDKLLDLCYKIINRLERQWGLI